ncbi:MAG: HWE histidine kinase domain-containing protein, partial [Rhodomicrobium sp.]
IPDIIGAPKKWSLNYWIAIVTSLILLAIASLLALSIQRARQDAFHTARLQVSYLATALQEDAEGTLDAVALAAELVKRRVETEGDGSYLSELKQEVEKYAAALTSIAVIGPDGSLRSTSGDIASVPGDFSDFDFFRLTRDSAAIGLRLGEPQSGLLPGRVIIPATQRLESKDGGFAGVVLFLLDPERGTALYRRVDLGMSGALLLVSEHGKAMWGFTLPRGLDPSVIGALTVNPEPLAEMKSGSAGTFIAMSALDGIERVYAWRRLPNFPVIALVGLGKAETLAAANRQAMRLLALGVLSAGFLLALTIILSREISRRIKQAQALEETNAKLAAAYVDINERERHEMQVNLLLREVNHRSKNMLAVVQAIARQTIAADPDDFIKRFAERIQALAASQDLLIKNEWRGVDLHELARSQLGHFKDLVDKRVELRGPPLLISASAAQTIGVALHELATNAGKYGALSDDSGCVEVSWSLEPKEGGAKTFVISWRERGGPAVTAPSQAGFGSIVLCRVAKESLDAQVELDYASTGLVWRLQCPVAEVMDGSRLA